MLGRTLGELAATMDEAELQVWGVAADMGLVFDPVLAVAQIRSSILNSQGAKTRPSDFLPRPAVRRAPPRGAAEQRALFQAATRGLPRVNA